MRLLWALLFAALFVASRARAESYEWERTQKLLQSEKLELDPSPEGKRIAYVRVVRDDVFVDDEIWPTWLNLAHGMSHDSVVRRELLFLPGEAFADARAEESMRNLRGMGIFALVRIVAVKTQRPDEVGVIVHTRDVWSLRLEEDFNITTKTNDKMETEVLINYLLLRLTERNLLGRNKQLGAELTVRPKNYLLSQFYYARRALGSAYRFKQGAGIYFGRDQNEAEGSSWSGAFGKPLYSLGQRFGWDASLAYLTYVSRQVKNGDVQTYQPDLNGPSALRVWRETAKAASFAVFFRQGQEVKHTTTLGFSMSDLDAKPIAETSLDKQLEAGFNRDVLPRQRTQSGPSISYRLFYPTFKVFTDLGTFGQSENVQVGPDLELGLRVPVRAFGSSTNSVVAAASAGFVLAPGGGLVDGSSGVSGRYEEGELVDQLFSAQVRGATPQFGIFRLVGRVGVTARRRDTSNSLVALGGSNGLRGYQSQAIYAYGASAAVANVELRTKPIAWQAVHIGAVLFYDVGTVYERWADFRPVYAVGVGLRLLFPQFNRYPFSFDAAAPIDPGFRIVPTIQSGQVVSLTATEDALRN